MKMEECIESIFGCLERIENKINGLSVALPEGNSPTVNNIQDESVLNEVRNDHETFRKLLARVYEGLAAIKNDMVSMDRKNSSQERLGQVLSEIHNEQRKNQEKVENLFCETSSGKCWVDKNIWVSINFFNLFLNPFLDRFCTNDLYVGCCGSMSEK